MWCDTPTDQGSTDMLIIVRARKAHKQVMNRDHGSVRVAPEACGFHVRSCSGVVLGVSKQSLCVSLQDEPLNMFKKLQYPLVGGCSASFEPAHPQP